MVGNRRTAFVLGDGSCVVDGDSYPASLDPDGAPCVTTVVSDPDTPFPLLQSAYPTRVQQADLAVTFSQPVGSLHIAGTGALKCSNATYGTIIAYDADSTELGRADLALTDSTDCAADDITFGAEASLAIASGVTRVVVLPPQPWSFPVGGATGYATAFYALTFAESAIEFAVTGVVLPLPDSSFTTLAGENQVALTASAPDSIADARIIWTVADDPTDQSDSDDPPDPAPGRSTTLTIATPTYPPRAPRTSGGTGRWYQALSHPGTRDEKALRYLVRAYYVTGNDTVRTDAVTIKQHDRDVLRQEYVDFAFPVVPPPVELENQIPGQYFTVLELLGSADYATLQPPLGWIARS